MSTITVGIVAVVLSAPVGSFSPEGPGTIVSEHSVRATSARLYSEVLRLACANGWKFRRSQVVSGFDRHFEEARLVLVDRGVRILPLEYTPELEVTELFFGLVEHSTAADRRACYKGRWRKKSPQGPDAVPTIRPVAN